MAFSEIWYLLHKKTQEFQLMTGNSLNMAEPWCSLWYTNRPVHRGANVNFVSYSQVTNLP